MSWSLESIREYTDLVAEANRRMTKKFGPGWLADHLAPGRRCDIRIDGWWEDASQRIVRISNHDPSCPCEWTPASDLFETPGYQP